MTERDISTSVKLAGVLNIDRVTIELRDGGRIVVDRSGILDGAMEVRNQTEAKSEGGRVEVVDTGDREATIKLTLVVNYRVDDEIEVGDGATIELLTKSDLSQ